MPYKKYYDVEENYVDYIRDRSNYAYKANSDPFYLSTVAKFIGAIVHLYQILFKKRNLIGEKIDAKTKNKTV